MKWEIFNRKTSGRTNTDTRQEREHERTIEKSKNLTESYQKSNFSNFRFNLTLIDLKLFSQEKKEENSENLKMKFNCISEFSRFSFEMAKNKFLEIS